jgi:hypothetical protein
VRSWEREISLERGGETALDVVESHRRDGFLFDSDWERTLGGRWKLKPKGRDLAWLIPYAIPAIALAQVATHQGPVSPEVDASGTTVNRFNRVWEERVLIAAGFTAYFNLWHLTTTLWPPADGPLPPPRSGDESRIPLQKALAKIYNKGDAPIARDGWLTRIALWGTGAGLVGYAASVGGEIGRKRSRAAALDAAGPGNRRESSRLRAEARELVTYQTAALMNGSAFLAGGLAREVPVVRKVTLVVQVVPGVVAIVGIVALF